MQINKYQKFSDDEIESEFICRYYVLVLDDVLAETQRIMWAMCRDRLEKEVLLEHWSKSDDYERLEWEVENFKFKFIKRVTKIAKSLIKPAPTWLDIYL